jgi:acyl-CoA reductase-like NAD-dependent aldehyde dehydrogenase
MPCRANATEFGLAAAVFTRDIDRARRVSRQINAGTVWTNTWLAINNGFEEGGYKRSGIGRLRGARGLADSSRSRPTSTSCHRPATDAAPATHD